MNTRKQYAAGNTYSVSPGDNIRQKLSVLQPGDTLIFNDGIYPSLQLDPNLGTALHGTSNAPITLTAANDGKAIIDGKGTSQAIFMNGSSYVTLEGFVARNSSDNNVYLWGGNNQPNDHIVLSRITAYNAGSGNRHNFANQSGNSNILIEDCAGWGRARYIFDNYHVSNTTLRRTLAYWETSDYKAPRAGYSAYSSQNVVFENVISRHVIPPPTVTNDPEEYASLYRTSDSKKSPAIDTYLRGVIFYDNWDGIYINSSSGPNTQITNSYLESPNTFSTAVGSSTNHKGDGIFWDNSYDGTITNSLIANSTIGIYQHNTSGTINITSSILLNNAAAFKNSVIQSYNDFWKNGSIGVQTDTTDQKIDPNYDINTYGIRGAYLFGPQNSLLKGAGQNGSDIGPNIIYRYQDGVLTNVPLWPWPMEVRIMAERGISVTWEAHGGLWKTLNGVYPPTATSTTM